MSSVYCALISVLQRTGNSLRVARLSLGESRIAYLSEDELHDRQSAAFQALVRHAYHQVPFYREWMRAAGAEPEDLRSVADLRRLPLVDKLELTMHPDRFASSAYAGRDGLTLVSSGTSGRRRSFRHDASALFESLAAGRRQRLVLREFIGKETAYREAVFNRQGSAGDQIRRFWESRMWTPRSLDLTRHLFSPALPYPALLAEVNEFRPQVYRGIGFQCEARKGFHISIDKVDVRVVDRSGVDVRPGEQGELVLTNLINRATVVMNYRLGDVVTQGVGRCSCGRTLPLIADIDGRLDDLIDRPGGTRLHALTILPKLQAVAGLSQVQVIQNSLDGFTLKAVWVSGAMPAPEDLRAQMAAVLGEQILVSVEAVDRLPQEPSGKVKSVINHCSSR